jgi:hypothetical protein
MVPRVLMGHDGSDLEREDVVVGWADFAWIALAWVDLGVFAFKRQ